MKASCVETNSDRAIDRKCAKIYPDETVAHVSPLKNLNVLVCRQISIDMKNKPD
jgi:hypothetical protein